MFAQHEDQASAESANEDKHAEVETKRVIDKCSVFWHCR